MNFETFQKIMAAPSGQRVMISSEELEGFREFVKRAKYLNAVYISSVFDKCIAESKGQEVYPLNASAVRGLQRFTKWAKGITLERFMDVFIPTFCMTVCLEVAITLTVWLVAALL